MIAEQHRGEIHLRCSKYLACPTRTASGHGFLLAPLVSTKPSRIVRRPLDLTPLLPNHSATPSVPREYQVATERLSDDTQTCADAAENTMVSDTRYLQLLHVLMSMRHDEVFFRVLYL